MFTPQFQNIFDIFEQNGHELWFVGGFVRDYLLNRFHNDLKHPLDPYIPFVYSDIDFATSAKPEETISILEKNGLKAIPIGMDFGTIQTIVDDKKIEITTFRSNESYTKGSRKPSVVFGKTIEEDLARRDFTVNAIAMSKEGLLTDPYEGHSALIQGLLMCPIDPKESFSDDPLRMLRACRFHAKYAGLARLEAEAITSLSSRIHDISAERIFEEMSKILVLPHADKALRLMVDVGLIKEIFPELQTVVDFKKDQGKWHYKDVWNHTLQVVKQAEPILEVRWAALFHDVAKPQTYSIEDSGVHFYGHEGLGAKFWNSIADRLKVSTEFKEHVYFLIAEHLQPSLLSANGGTSKSIRKLIAKAKTKEKLDNLFHLSMSDITSHNPTIVEDKKKKCEELKQKTDSIFTIKLPHGTGTVLAAELGLGGKALGALMRQLTESLVDGTITQDDIVKEARRIHAETYSGR
jgi:putative nucleotidyltransferase with HDIG domain